MKTKGQINILVKNLITFLIEKSNLYKSDGHDIMIIFKDNSLEIRISYPRGENTPKYFEYLKTKILEGDIKRYISDKRIGILGELMNIAYIRIEFIKDIKP